MEKSKILIDTIKDFYSAVNYKIKERNFTFSSFPDYKIKNKIIHSN